MSSIEVELPPRAGVGLDDELGEQLDAEPDAGDAGPPDAGTSGVFGGGTPGVCKVCGEPARSTRATYCEEHYLTHSARAQRNAGKSKTKPVVTVTPAPRAASSSKPKPPASPDKAPNGREWRDFLAGLFGIATTGVGMIVTNDLPPGPDRDAMAADLGMTDDEAAAFAGPFARLLAGTTFSAKYGRKVIDHSDLVDAGVAAWTYFDRTSAALRDRRRRTEARAGYAAGVTPLRRDPTNGEPAREEAAQQQPGFSPFGPGTNLTPG